MKFFIINIYDFKKTLNEKIFSKFFIIVFSKNYDFFDIFFYTKIDFFFYRFNDYKILLIFNKKLNFNFIYNII